MKNKTKKYIFYIGLILLVINIIVPDPIPYIDEVIMMVADVLLYEWSH